MIDRGLRASGLRKVFGGLTAVDNVSLALDVGVLHAVIGPNGAAKTTLINLLSGDLPPTAGSIHLNGQDIVGYSSDQRSRLGIGRTYQKISIFASFTVLENCRLAAQSRKSHAANLFRSAGSYPSLRHEAVRALATRPQVLLLDEPLSGMGAEESASMVRLVRELAKDHAILLVEHDMDAVFALADALTVMVNGRVLASGKPEEIRASPDVQRAYLGSAEARHG